MTSNTTSLFEDVWDINDTTTNIIRNPKQVDKSINNENWDSILDVYEEYKKPEIKPIYNPITLKPVKEIIKKNKKKKEKKIKKTHEYDEYDVFIDK